MTRRAQPVVDAIERYRADHGRPPQTLGELAPKYLPAIAEAPWPWDTPGFHYEGATLAFPAETFYWWRAGEHAEPLAYTYVCRPPEDDRFAVFSVTVDEGGRVAQGLVDVLDVSGAPFDVARWRRHLDRERMARSLVDSVRGKPITDLIRDLGPPDGRLILAANAYRLDLVAETGLRVVYLPSGDYRHPCWSSPPRRVGRWGFLPP